MGNENLQDRKPWPWSITEMPTDIKDLIGRKVRIIKAGNVVTQDYQPGRVTIHLTNDQRIEDIKIEPGTPSA